MVLCYNLNSIIVISIVIYQLVDGTILQLMSIYGWYYVVFIGISNDSFASWNTSHNVMPVCMASYMMVGYGHANHAFEG
jgi:hypothetical protein